VDLDLDLLDLDLGKFIDLLIDLLDLDLGKFGKLDLGKLGLKLDLKKFLKFKDLFLELKGFEYTPTGLEQLVIEFLAVSNMFPLLLTLSVQDICSPF